MWRKFVIFQKSKCFLRVIKIHGQRRALEHVINMFILNLNYYLLKSSYLKNFVWICWCYRVQRSCSNSVQLYSSWWRRGDQLDRTTADGSCMFVYKTGLWKPSLFQREEREGGKLMKGKFDDSNQNWSRKKWKPYVYGPFKDYESKIGITILQNNIRLVSQSCRIIWDWYLNPAEYIRLVSQSCRII